MVLDGTGGTDGTLILQDGGVLGAAGGMFRDLAGVK